MKTFKYFITEKATYQQDVSGYVFVSQNFLPLSTPMIDRIFGKEEFKRAFHITSFEGFDKLIKIQGTKKQISTLTTIEAKDMKMIKKGLAGGGGVFVALEGYPVVSFGEDVYTRVDSQGRRWVEMRRLIGVFDQDLIDEKVRLMNKYPIKNPNFDLSDNNIEAYSKYIEKSDKAKFIKDYIDFCEKLIKKNLNSFKNIFKDKFVIGYTSYTWDEIVMNNIKVKKIWISMNDNDTEDVVMKKFNFMGKHSKYDPEPLNDLGLYMSLSKIFDDWLK